MPLSASKKAFIPAIAICILTSIIVLRFGALILMLILLPAILAFFLDRDSRRSMFKIVAACNLSAALPFIVPIIEYSLKKKYAEVGLVMEQPISWVFVYCGGAAGWAMLYLSKFASKIVTLMHYEFSVAQLEKKQQLLIKEWGESIAEQDRKRK